ncbi:flagellar biosynthesis protein FlhB [Modestobacter sp. Leaf380]|uniref:EscU/YscU/HrcU family type III secretion system export apparatus switch protein n=1 Tax=Modestobacter sp. Leaf380 TaxID=1736356 RepID=UPI0006F71306|nr:EscU/YscU/HrcU family type III secretion system export apparatus switch protein [Modestobacter sp. Leaf380]KQS68402.1 type III secretion protein [Modestobacter sp. Leaf380]
MAKEGPGGEKTEKPTPERLKKARRDGDVPRTQELGTWLGVVTASFLLPFVAGRSFDGAQRLFVQIGAVARRPEISSIEVLLGEALTAFLTAVLPMAAAIMVVGVLASASQGGIVFSAKPMAPKLSKLNPFPGFKRMFGGHGLWETTKALVKTAAIGVTIVLTIDKARTLVASSGSMPLSAVASVFTDSALLMLRVAAMTGLVLAVADYMVVRMQSRKKLKMSLYEIKQEHKQQEGDPHVKGQRRSAMLAAARNRMMTDVTTADVLLTNPTHVAVALKYDAAFGAPRVVAKGAGEVARKLRELAAASNVPMVQDIPLARALHGSCELGQEVPPQLFTAVARVLAFVMHLGAQGIRGGVHRPGFSAPDTTGLPVAGRRRAPAADPADATAA